MVDRRARLRGKSSSLTLGLRDVVSKGYISMADLGHRDLPQRPQDPHVLACWADCSSLLHGEKQSEALEVTLEGDVSSFSRPRFASTR